MQRVRENAGLIRLESEVRSYNTAHQLSEDNLKGFMPDFEAPLSQRPPALKGKSKKRPLTTENQLAMTELLIEELPANERDELQQYKPNLKFGFS